MPPLCVTLENYQFSDANCWLVALHSVPFLCNATGTVRFGIFCPNCCMVVVQAEL